MHITHFVATRIVLLEIETTAAVVPIKKNQGQQITRAQKLLAY